MKEKAKELYALQEIKLEVQYPFITIKDKCTNDLEHLFDKLSRHFVKPPVAIWNDKQFNY